MDPNEVRGRMNELLYAIDSAPDLSDKVAARLVDNMIEGRPFASTPVADFADAIDQTLKAGALHPQTAEMSRRYSEPELLDFLRRVAERLDARRPWQAKRFTKLDVSRWASFDDTAVIARVERPTHQISAAVGFAFDHLQVGDDKLPVLVLQLRTGEVVALRGSTDLRSTSFALLHHGQGKPAEVIDHFRKLTRFGADDVVPI